MKPYLSSLSIDQLAEVSGGMRWEEFRRSTNVEDRRSPKAIARDNAWWQSQHEPQPQTVPLPPRRPAGL